MVNLNSWILLKDVIELTYKLILILGGESFELVIKKFFLGFLWKVKKYFV